MVSATQHVSLYITGIGHEYPSYSYGPQEFENVVARLYPQFQTSPGLGKLLQLNRKTQIKSRQSVLDIKAWTKDDATPPPIDELSRLYRKLGVDLAVAACTKAMQEASVEAANITHVVAVTCTDQGNPGYDMLVCQQLKLRPSVQRVLLHGVGCAGGLSALRAAANIAAAETQRGRAARVLVVACELCSLFLKAELQAASRDDTLHVAPALFSDAAAALVVCNGLGMERHQKPIFELLEWGSMAVPGMIATITKEVPTTALGAIQPMFDHLLAKTDTAHKQSSWAQLKPAEFDWALHPGGAAILHGAQQTLQLTDSHLNASRHVYQNYGNSSSPTVLIILDELRNIGAGRDHVVSASFGPGMMIEMCVMKRCREVAVAPPLPVKKNLNERYRLWLGIQSKLVKTMIRFAGFRHVEKAKQELVTVG